MIQTIRWLAVLVVPMLLLCGSVVDARQAKKDSDKDAGADKWIPTGKVIGKVVQVYEDKRKIRLAVPMQTLNPAGVQGLAQAQAQMLQAQASRNYQSIIQAQQALINAQRGLYTVENKEVEVQAIDDVVVRMINPRPVFDDKGKIKRLTAAEKKELKGDPKQPGYKAEFSDVQTEQTIQVTLVRKRGAPVPRPSAARAKLKKGKDDDAAAAADLLEENQPQIGVIMILAEPPSSK